MSTNVNQLTWREVYNDWKYASGDSFSSLLSPDFLSVPTHYRNARKDEFFWASRNDLKSGNSVYDSLNDGFLDPTGPIRTAEMLWVNKNSIEKVALVWLRAGLNSYKHQLHDYRMSAKILTEITEVITQETDKHDIEAYHGRTTRFFPELYLQHIIEFALPRTSEEIIALIAIEMMLVHSNWQVVRLTHQ